MAEDAASFRARAAAERANASATALDNVRERCGRAAQSWDALATRAERAEASRERREASVEAK